MSNQLKQTSQKILSEVDPLSRKTVDHVYASQAKYSNPYASGNYTKSLRDVVLHFSYLAEAIKANEISLFLDYIGWLKVVFAGLNFSPEILDQTLESMREALRETLPSELFIVALAYIDPGLKHLSHAPERLESSILPNSPFNELASAYLDALLRGDRQAASQLILNRVRQGVSVKDIYLHVFQPCQQEVGRLWQMNLVSVAQEHFATAATQMIMSQLYPYIFTTKTKEHRLVATALGGELHEIGVRMVTDIMEMEGWDTYYLGANSPDESILQAIEEWQADILAISVTMTHHLSRVTNLIDAIRTSKNLSVKILVGGHPFNVAPGLWQKVGADGFAYDAQQAVLVANRLLRERG